MSTAAMSRRATGVSPTVRFWPDLASLRGWSRVHPRRRLRLVVDTDMGALAAECWEVTLDHDPSWGHLLGRMEFAGSFERPSLAVEDAHLDRLRDLHGRVAAVDEASLGHQDRLTRDFLLSHLDRTLGLTEARLTDLGVDSVWGVQTTLGVNAGLFGIPDAQVAAAVDTYRSLFKKKPTA